mmetsp:Transcript_29832/g.62541  ORF Transcript_29832/g.62541 Transcript_29832/m.62541 type:complete len:448 (-) Transcript_29832:12-1355(-)
MEARGPAASARSEGGGRGACRLGGAEGQGQLGQLGLKLLLALRQLRLARLLAAGAGGRDAVVRHAAVERDVAEEGPQLLRQRRRRRPPRLLVHAHVGDDEGAHGLDDGHGAGDHAGVVPALSLQHGIGPHEVRRRLRLSNGGGGLEGDAQHDGHAVADAALHAAAVVGGGEHAAVGLDAEHVVVGGAAHAGAGEARPDLEALGRRDRQHRVPQHRLELVEARLAEPDGHVAQHHAHHAPHRVLLLARLLDAVDHLVRRLEMRAAHHVGVHLLAGDGVHVGVLLRALDVPHGADPGDDFDAVLLLEPLLRDGARRHAPDGLARARAPTAARRPEAVLHLIGEVGVGGPRHLAHFAVVVRPHVFVSDKEADWRAKSDSLFGSGQDGDRIFLISPRADTSSTSLARTTSVQLNLDIRLGESHPGRHAINDAPNAWTVTFTKGGDTEIVSE